MSGRKKIDTQTKKLFAAEQRDFFEKSYQEELEEERNKVVECLGMTFPNDEERRKHFLGILREKLKDPEFRKIEGFPIGSDEDILALSDPPYYTACPNPFITDFIEHYGKPYDPSRPYSREPFAVDVSEGKTDPIYKAQKVWVQTRPRVEALDCEVYAYAAALLKGLSRMTDDRWDELERVVVGSAEAEKEDAPGGTRRTVIVKSSFMNRR